MAKYVATKDDDSIGAKLLDDETAVIAKMIDGRKVVEIIKGAEKVNEVIDKALPIVSEILQKLADFFNSIFHRFPTVIIMDGVSYVYTIQPSPFKGIDRVFYMSTEDKNDILFLHEDPKLPRAKKELRKELKQFGYI